MKYLAKKLLQQSNIELIELDEVFVQVLYWTQYFISNYGRLVRKNNKNEGYHIIPPTITQGNYLTYKLSKPARKYRGKKVRDENGKPKSNSLTITANRLVALMFCKNPYEGKYDYSLECLDSHHKNHDRQNNHEKNLMLLANGKNGTRADHYFVNSIKRIAIYNEETCKYHSYKDIERLCKRVDLDILELIDVLKDKDTPSITDGEWITYRVNEWYVGVQFYKKKKKKNKKKQSNRV